MLVVAVSPAPTFAQSAPGSAPHIAAAADLQFALPEIAAAFARGGGAPLKFSFGSSGNFARQIVQGAPFELFLSADERFVAQVVAAQRAEGGRTVSRRRSGDAPQTAPELAIPIELVTHDLDEARQLADRVVVLHRGKALPAGTPEDVFLRPNSPAVARLVGLSNLFAGTVGMDNGKPCLERAGRRLAIADFCHHAPGSAVN